MADEKHCPTCICGRRAPVQGNRAINGNLAHGPGTISWVEHLQAWSGYASRYPGQSAEIIAKRAGFDWLELVEYLGHEPTTWEPRR